MAFIANHFYKLVKMPPTEVSKNSFPLYGFNDRYTVTSFGSYCSDTNSYLPRDDTFSFSKRFEIGGIYHAKSKNTLYDRNGFSISLEEEEINYFEEVDLKLSDGTKKFLESLKNKTKIVVRFIIYTPSNLVGIILKLHTRYGNPQEYTVCSINEIEKSLHKLYNNVMTEYARCLVFYIKHSYYNYYTFSNWNLPF